MQELSGWLARVEAPPELWDRVSGGPLADARGSGAMSRDRQGAVGLLAFAAAASALVLAIFFFPRTFHSSDPAQIRAWVHSKAGIDLPLPAKLSPSVRLISARMRDKDTAQVAYQVDGRDALLLVSLASAAMAGDGRHRGLRNTATRGANTTSWTMRGLIYTVICPSPEVSQVACQLCHSL